MDAGASYESSLKRPSILNSMCLDNWLNSVCLLSFLVVIKMTPSPEARHCDKCGSKKDLQFYGGEKHLALCLIHHRKWMKAMDRTKFKGNHWQKEYERQYWVFCGKPLPPKIGNVATQIRSVLKSMPFSAEYKANRYDTDDEIVLSVWNEGITYDIRIKK